MAGVHTIFAIGEPIGPVKADGRRVVREALLTMGRKNGKAPAELTWNRDTKRIMPWDGNTRIRYVTCVCGHRFKAIEVDEVFDG